MIHGLAARLARQMKGDASYQVDSRISTRSLALTMARRGFMVLPGAVVNRDVPPYAIVGGLPARVIGVRGGNDAYRN